MLPPASAGSLIAGIYGVYRLDWIEQLKLRLTATPGARQIVLVSPVVWSLGFTSLLTDISTEMVNSALPVYLVLHLHLSPVQYGVIDGLYNGFAIALLSIAAGLLADRWRRHKEIAQLGYGLSGLCKLLLLAAGGAWVWIAAIVGLDRTGKGMRAAPRDALISFATPKADLASAFAVHRALDAGGALLGPVIAFIVLAQLPGGFDVLWVTSFVFAVLGFAVLALFVPGSRNSGAPERRETPTRWTRALFSTPKFGALAMCALLLAFTTISDGFIYLLLQRRTTTPASILPLFYVGTACFYMLFSIPVGACADRWGRRHVLVAGYAVLALVYVAVLTLPGIGLPAAIACLALMGLYYAGTEGILMAMASSIVPPEVRTSGLAVLGTAIAIGKMCSSVLFGWLWSTFSQVTAVVGFIVALSLVLALAAGWLRSLSRDAAHV